MYKAFLSHSSIDKQEVRKIKNKLQRFWTYFDEDCFEAGEDFRNAIMKRLNDTNLFVLFVSNNSLSSFWVQFEIDEAYWQTVKRDDIQVLILTLDDISISALPEWMQRCKVEAVKTADLAAQLIKRMLFQTLSVNLEVYIGREDNTKRFYDEMTSYEPDFPNIMALIGLNGIGRRTFIKDILEKRFSINYAVEFDLSELDGNVELYRKLLDDNIEKNSQDVIMKLDEWFRNASIAEQAEEIARILACYTEKGACPIIIDDNCMLKDDGFYKKAFLEMLRTFGEKYQDHYLAILHTRLPKLEYADKRLIYIHRLYALDEASCYSLFDSLLKRNRVPVADSAQVKEISEYLEGYPPAIHNATCECILEGVDIICNDKSSLVDFQAHLFSKYLEKIPLLDFDIEILTIIHNLGTVNIKIINAITEKSTEEIAKTLKMCHDYNIVEQRSNGSYLIAPPMRMAVNLKFHRYNKKEFSRIAIALIKKFWTPQEDISFEVIDIIINTILQSDQEQQLVDFKQYILPSHLLKAGEKANQETDWGLAEKYARKALELDNGLNDARVLLFKELVRQESFKTKAKYDAEENSILHVLRTERDIRSYYLEGFRFWKRRRFYNAIEQFEFAIQSGDDSISVHRDLAECYYQTGQIEKAQDEVNRAMGNRKINNPFILDLASKIAISLGKMDDANELLNKQELVDRYENVEHRKATYYMKAEEYSEAFLHATNACNGTRVLPEMHLLRMNIAIHLRSNKVVEQEYDYVKKNYKHYNADICEALYVTMILNTKGWRAAEARFVQVSNKKSPIALGLKQKILVAKLNDRMLSPLQRQEANKELEETSRKKMTDILFQIQYYDYR